MYSVTGLVWSGLLYQRSKSIAHSSLSPYLRPYLSSQQCGLALGGIKGSFGWLKLNWLRGRAQMIQLANFHLKRHGICNGCIGSFETLAIQSIVCIRLQMWKFYFSLLCSTLYHPKKWVQSLTDWSYLQVLLFICCFIFLKHNRHGVRTRSPWS